MNWFMLGIKRMRNGRAAEEHINIMAYGRYI
jgi:hypothetical protein